MNRCDILIVGAGPAGAVAAIVAARAGARVLVLDRESFPRDKLCGDTLNPGALAVLRSVGIEHEAARGGLPLEGMRLTGEGGVTVDAGYPGGLEARSLSRRVLDERLLRCALAAGAQFEPGVAVERPIVDDGGRVTGVVGRNGASGLEFRASVVIAADGRRSRLAFALGLLADVPAPRRWATGVYCEGVQGLTARGEMHIRRGRYIGVAPLPDGLANVCLVRPHEAGSPTGGDIARWLLDEVRRDPLLGRRFERARPVTRPAVLGPLAVDAAGTAVAGLFTAGDAAGFIDPMTGDGLRFALRGGALAGAAALDALAHGWTDVHARLAAVRQREFGRKWQFNRAVRTLVAKPGAVMLAARGARVVPAVVRRMVAYAGDCGLAGER